MRIAIPSEHPGGLEAPISPHFGHCAVFTIVDLNGSEISAVNLLPNMPHQQGGCMAPVMLLKQQGVEALMAGGMGMRPLAGFQQVGIDVYYTEDAVTVSQVIGLFTTNKTRIFGPAQTCGGGHEHGGGCQH